MGKSVRDSGIGYSQNITLREGSRGGQQGDSGNGQKSVWRNEQGQIWKDLVSHVKSLDIILRIR